MVVVQLVAQQLRSEIKRGQKPVNNRIIRGARVLEIERLHGRRRVVGGRLRREKALADAGLRRAEERVRQVRAEPHGADEHVVHRQDATRERRQRETSEVRHRARPRRLRRVEHSGARQALHLYRGLGAKVRCQGSSLKHSGITQGVQLCQRGAVRVMREQDVAGQEHGRSGDRTRAVATVE